MRTLVLNNLHRINENIEGAEPKILIKDSDGQRKILKMQKKNWSNIYSEHFASKFINISGGLAHTTELVNVVENMSNSSKTAVLCTDFTEKYGKLSSFQEGTDSIDTNIGNYGYYFKDILHILNSYHRVDFIEIEDDFWKMYCFDLILGNFDRHAGNWGICKSGGMRKFSPLYDNAGCFLPRANFNIILAPEQTEEEWWWERVFIFPRSKIMFETGKRERSNYKEVWDSNIIPKKIKNIFKNLDIDSIIHELFVGENLISCSQKDFYTRYIKLRYYCIVLNMKYNEALSKTRKGLDW